MIECFTYTPNIGDTDPVKPRDGGEKKYFFYADDGSLLAAGMSDMTRAD